jgi:hypothetical protein
MSDPELYQLELEHLFGRAWIALGHVTEIPEPGSLLLIFGSVTISPLRTIAICSSMCFSVKLPNASFFSSTISNFTAGNPFGSFSGSPSSDGGRPR